jgi:hypothetical protein
LFVTAQGSAYVSFRLALDRGNVIEALSAASELQFVRLAEALELTLLLVDAERSTNARPRAGIRASFRRRRTWACARVRPFSP